MSIVITSGIFLQISLSIVIICILVHIYRSRADGIGKREIMTVIWKGSFAFYICIIISFTLLPIRIPGEIPYDFEYNFNVLRLLDAMSSRAALISYSENILLFMPITILGCLADIKITETIKGGIILALLISLGVESLQGLEGVLEITEDMAPIMDVNDVICNTVGGGLGYLLIRYHLHQDKA